MPTTHSCPFDGKELHNRRKTQDHIKKEHQDKIQALLTHTNHDKIENLQNRGINPETWAASYHLLSTLR